MTRRDDDDRPMRPDTCTCGTCGWSWCMRCHPCPSARSWCEGSDRHAEIADEEERYRAAARNLYGSEDVEVDEGATVSRGDDAGAFVAAWVWVRDGALSREVV